MDTEFLIHYSSFAISGDQIKRKKGGKVERFFQVIENSLNFVLLPLVRAVGQEKFIKISWRFKCRECRKSNRARYLSCRERRYKRK